jgi:hypothetical protein
MPIGYANFGTIQQGNQQVVNSMAGLGQQIAGAIENHAATQSAQAMLPMLQQQYQQGMQKIASGDPNGIGDIYGASLVASQNPLLAPMAGHAINLANSANIQTQHTLRSQAAQQGMMERYQMRYGQGVQQKPITANEKANLITKYRSGANALWDKVQDKVPDFINPSGNEKNAEEVSSAIARYNSYKQDLADQGIQFSDPNFESAIAQAGETTSGLQQQIQKDKNAQTGGMSLPFIGKVGQHPLSEDFQTMQKRVKSIAPSTIQAAKSSANNQDALLNSARSAIQRGANPDAVMKRLQEHGIDTSGMNLQTPSNQSSSAMPANQPTSMIPAASGQGNVSEDDQGDLVPEDAKFYASLPEPPPI